MNNPSIKFIKIVTYILIVILVGLIFYDIYIIYQNKNSHRIPNNAINVSPITGEPFNVSNANPILSKIDYDCHEFNKLPYVESADIIMEQYNSQTTAIDYSAYVFNKTIKVKDGISSLSKINTTAFPKINFIDDLSFKETSITLDNGTIYINYNDDNVTSFTYDNGYYKKFAGTTLDKFSLSNDDVKYSNVVVQYLDNDSVLDCFYKNSFKATLFSNGKRQNFLWDGKSFIFENNSPATFLKGKTYWILLPKNISYTFANK